jgi:hypothetical protein
MDFDKKHAVHRDNYKLAYALMGEHAKWLLSTLLLLNSGAIAGVFQKDLTNKHLLAICLFGCGVLCALIAGAAGWFNLQYAAGYYRGLAEDVLANKQERPPPTSITRMRTFAIFATIASIICLALGSVLIAFALR